MQQNKHDIIHLQIEPTTRCNLSCTSCLKSHYSAAWVEKEMSLDLLDAVLCNAPGVKTIHLQGWGEPLLHPDLSAMIKLCKARGLGVSFTTNGTIMDVELANRLTRAGLDSITFSMAGGSADVQDAVRGHGSFDILMQSMGIILDTRKTKGKPSLKVGISYLLTPESVGQLPGVIQWCRRAGVDSLTSVHLTQAACRHQENLQFFPESLSLNHKWLRFYTNALALGKKFDYALAPFTAEALPMCEKNPVSTCFVAADGAVSPCVFLNAPVAGGIEWKKGTDKMRQTPVIFGNLKRSALADIYQTPKYEAFRSAFLDRSGLYGQALSKVGVSFEGTAQLEQANKTIAKGFKAHPVPAPCRMCRKLDGF